MIKVTKGVSRNLYILYTLAHLKQKANVRGTILGYLWWFIEPLMLIALYSYVVGVIFGHSGPDRILMIAIGVTLWKWWSTSLSSATTSFKRYKGIVTQVKMPLPILPISEVFGQTYLFIFGYSLLQSILLFMGYIPDVLALVITFITTIIVISAMSLGLAMLNVFVRDTAFLVGFGLRILFYITPIIYSIDRVPENYRWLVNINPLAQLIDLFNRALVYPETVNIMNNLTILTISIFSLASLLYISRSLRTQIIRNV
ncbi:MULTISPECIES: ABC transporter permease [Vibrio]|uniref:ABC transporter permease n=1 Tax=Vibrio TaxID=662 RepID=UPI0002E3A1A6|nr:MULTISPECIES: ABC transporter permease [Vibrio]NAZ54546.1 ABC transporter permease [Vibrio toranzoniae]OEE90336.1 hypothetical protein A140_03215 [Vibrio crassostreae 9ZC88]PMK25530.1 hypothetical protein BCU05_06660 [Vibrio sp. 10N.261.54.C3]PMN99353.1 hypothetical protein BCT20_15155 [Vibrio sp. 10N.222.55.C12]PMO14471.1 hypothetical protein BCT16_19230 [Vibrio sp. 10N.222.54.B6]